MLTSGGHWSTESVRGERGVCGGDPGTGGGASREGSPLLAATAHAPGNTSLVDKRKRGPNGSTANAWQVSQLMQIPRGFDAKEAVLNVSFLGVYIYWQITINTLTEVLENLPGLSTVIRILNRSDLEVSQSVNIKFLIRIQAPPEQD